MNAKNETTIKVAKTDPRLIGWLRIAGRHAWDLAKRAWRIDAVKSAALTWAIRASIPGAAIIVAIVDSYVGNS